MDKLKEQQILDLIENRPDLDYVKIALFTGSNLTAVAKVAKDNNCQRKRGRRPWKKVTPMTTPVVSAQRQ
jgi:hypothetical protein